MAWVGSSAMGAAPPGVWHGTPESSAVAMNGRIVHGESGTSLARHDDEGSALRTFEEEERSQRRHPAGVTSGRLWPRH